MFRNDIRKRQLDDTANTIVGVDIDYVELSDHSTMIMLVASGTAVAIED